MKIKFTDFWDVFDPTNNYFLTMLSNVCSVELSDNPDILIYSVFGNEHRNYACKKIFFSGEKIPPNFNECDYSFSFDYINDPRHYRLPLYALYFDPYRLIKDLSDRPQLKKKFCCFVVTNSGCEERNRIFHKLSKYKRVDSGGLYLNNIGNFIANKWDFISEYKFTIAYENAEYPGYTSEKLAEPMVMGSIPIYWGNKLVGRDFNTHSFFNYYDYPSEDAMIEHIIDVDKDDGLYLNKLQQPWYINNQINEFIKKENVLRHFQMIVNSLHRR